MTRAYWKAKIWGLLHDPALKALHDNTGGNSFWRDLAVMAEWKQKNWNPEDTDNTILEHIKLADYITSASDRGAIANIPSSVNYDENGLKISHLLSGEKLPLKIQDHEELLTNRLQFLQTREDAILEQIPESANQDEKRLFWWLWRCLPEATCQAFNDDSSLLLMPAETRFPDASLWSHASLTAAMAGALAGYDLTDEDIKNPTEKSLSHAYLVNFTFNPIQELIKASRKMRDFWAGSWILHYLSAWISWKLALKYGPDCLLYPSLYQQPLIDHWLLQTYPDFNDWVSQPSDRALLTAGFPNNIILILPQAKVEAAMQMAKSTLLEEWRHISTLVFKQLKQSNWMKDLTLESKTWQGWLESQWQTYWAAVPIGKEGAPLTSSEIYKREDTDNSETPPSEDENQVKKWLEIQNHAYNLSGDNALFKDNELTFLRQTGELRRTLGQKPPYSANVGSWWNHIFDQTRVALAAVKNVRTWEIPTAFGPRSTISGLGPVVHPNIGNDWITEGETQHYWTRQVGLFDGTEELNATETVKRGLHRILPRLLNLSNQDIVESYPDLTAGVAGYLKTGTPEDLAYFHQACQRVRDNLPQNQQAIITQQWGIPWIDNPRNLDVQQCHPRLLNAGWLMEDLDIPEDDIKTYRQDLQKVIDRNYPNNNPANWYVLAAGDGDDMSKWLKGEKLNKYKDYISGRLKSNMDQEKYPEILKSFETFLEQPKRMGPSTHNALSRALLDFSNQLVPYLTEERYAGRLIYSGGDDVLAYTNLWEWDQWLWDIRQCFRGDKDPLGFDEFGHFNVENSEFNNTGDYWQWRGDQVPKNLANRPLFTMGNKATISFGVVIAHHSVPLAIALENLWEAEDEAKEYYYQEGTTKKVKDSVQVRVIYGSGNTLKTTTQFNSFHAWQKLLTINPNIEPSIFEQAANIWEQHPIPCQAAITPWTIAFCERRQPLESDSDKQFQSALAHFLDELWKTSLETELDKEVKNWLKLAAFVVRRRKIEFKV